MSILGDELAKGFKQVTKEFTQAKHRAAGRSLTEREYAWLRAQEKRKERETIKAATWQVMAQAYAHASGNGSLPVSARQMMYAARPLVLQITGGKCWQRTMYFTQYMLPDYLEEHPDETANWDIVFDARGHFYEPHTDYQFALGTLEVRGYVNSWEHRKSDKVDEFVLESAWPTIGPVNRYKYALFVEKEGFNSLFESSRIRERYDIGIFSTKGMSVTSARALVEALTKQGVTILVMHDFDLSGLTICHTLGHDTRRFKFSVEPKIIDLGLRLEDVEAMGLQSEPVVIKQSKDPKQKFLEEDYDLSQDEFKFLVQNFHNPYYTTKGSYWDGRRVELNAMTSRQVIDWLEDKLQEHGVSKVVPDEKTLAAAWHRAMRVEVVNRKVAEAIEELNAQEQGQPPKDLAKLLSEQLKPGMPQSWDEVLAKMVAKKLPAEAAEYAGEGETYQQLNLSSHITSTCAYIRERICYDAWLENSPYHGPTGVSDADGNGSAS
jgi:hypothetical protein